MNHMVSYPISFSFIPPLLFHSLPLLSIAQFVVRVCRPGVVSLQSARQNIDWLAIYEGRAIGNVSYNVSGCGLTHWSLPFRVVEVLSQNSPYWTVSQLININ